MSGDSPFASGKFSAVIGQDGEGKEVEIILHSTYIFDKEEMNNM